MICSQSSVFELVISQWVIKLTTYNNLFMSSKEFCSDCFKRSNQMFCSTPCWTFATCSPVFTITCFDTKVVNYSVIKNECLDLVEFCQQEKCFLFLIRAKRLREISCGENANFNDVVRLGLWPLTLLPLGCVCIRTVKGHIFPLSHGLCMLENCVDLLWSTHQNIKRSNVRLTSCSPCCSQGCLILPHT